MDSPTTPDERGLQSAAFVFDLEYQWRYLDRDADREGVAADVFADYDPSAFLVGDREANALATAAHAAHRILLETAAGSWMAWWDHYTDGRERATVVADRILAALAGKAGGDRTLSGEQLSAIRAALEEQYGLATRSATDEWLEEVDLPAPEAVATVVRQAHAAAMARPPGRSPWLVDRLARDYARAVAQYSVPGHEDYGHMYDLAGRMADSYENALAVGLPPAWAVEAPQYVNWSEDLLASPSGLTMQSYLYSDTTLIEHSGEIAAAVIGAYLAARHAGAATTAALEVASTAYRNTLVALMEDDADELAREDTAPVPEVVRRAVVVYERAAGQRHPAQAGSVVDHASLAILVQDVTALYRGGLDKISDEVDDEGRA